MAGAPVVGTMIYAYVAESTVRTRVAHKARHSRLDCSPGCAVQAAISQIDGNTTTIAKANAASH